MKRLLLLIIAIVFCNHSAYAIIKRMKVEYKSEGRIYMVVLGNFDKRTLVDGLISIKVVDVSGTAIYINGKYEKGEINGEFHYGGFIVEVQGSISNNKNGGILTKCNPYDWRCSLQTKATIPFYDSYCRVPATVTPYKTPPINITGESKDSFESCWGLAFREIKQNIDNRKKKINYKEFYPVTITYKGGLIYKGCIKQVHNTFTIPSSTPSVDEGASNMLDAELIWSNGDSFEGKVQYGTPILVLPVDNSGPYTYEGIIPYRGIIKYHDGQVFEYNKSGRDFADFKIGDNGLCVSPSEMKESFENTIKAREEERLRKIREEEESKAAELKAEQEEREKEIARKNELIRKYGQKYGEAIFNGDPKMGMTIKMVQDIHQEQGRMSRRISQGREITILTYGGDYVSFGGISRITPRYEYTFVDGKLIEFSSTDGQTSIYW